VGISNPIRILFAVTILSCLLALLLMPGATTAVVERTHPSGKQFVRIASLLSMIVLAVGFYRGLHTGILGSSFRLVYAHGFGSDLLDKTCVRLC
jgi:hypothetical protein